MRRRDFRYERIYALFYRLTRRLSNRQIMMLLAMVVGLLAGLGTYVFEILLYTIKSCLVNWFPVEDAHILLLIYPAAGIILATLFVRYIVRDDISEGVTRVLYAMSRRDSRIAPHNCWTSIVGGATTIGFGGSVGPEAPIVLTGAAHRLERGAARAPQLPQYDADALLRRRRGDRRHLQGADHRAWSSCWRF